MLRADVIDEDRARIAFGHGGRAKAGRALSRWLSVNVYVETTPDHLERSEWRTHTLLYDFSLFDDESEGDFLLAYHFHPDPSGRGTNAPHLHLGARPSWGPRSFKKIHLPTGRVSCEAFIRLLITELDVRRARADWDDVLRRSEANFASRRTW